MKFIINIFVRIKQRIRLNTDIISKEIQLFEAGKISYSKGINGNSLQ
jgi:hypothetical protein